MLTFGDKVKYCGEVKFILIVECLIDFSITLSCILVSLKKNTSCKVYETIIHYIFAVKVSKIENILMIAKS